MHPSWAWHELGGSEERAQGVGRSCTWRCFFGSWSGHLGPRWRGSLGRPLYFIRKNIYFGFHWALVSTELCCRLIVLLPVCPSGLFKFARQAFRCVGHGARFCGHGLQGSGLGRLTGADRRRDGVRVILLSAVRGGSPQSQDTGTLVPR